MDAQALIDCKTRSMQRTLYMLSIEAEKLVRHPLQWRAGMRAAVDIAVIAPQLVDDKYFLVGAGQGRGKSTGASRRNFIDCTELYMMR